jgi:hypothetical protein
MLTSLGSLRRSKSTSSVTTRRTKSTRHPPPLNDNLSPTSQRHAQVAAETAFERSLGVEVLPNQHRPLRVRRSTIAESAPSTLHHRPSAHNIGIAVSSQSARGLFTTPQTSQQQRDSIDLQPPERPLPPAPNGLTRSRSSYALSRAHRFNPLREASTSIDTLPEYSPGLRRASSRHSVDTIVEGQVVNLPAPFMSTKPIFQSPSTSSQGAGIRRSRSMRRTLRSEEPGPSASRQEQKSKLVNSLRLPIPLEPSKSPFSFTQIRKSKSMYTWGSSAGQSSRASSEANGPFSSPFGRRHRVSPAPTYFGLRNAEGVSSPLREKVADENGIVINTAKKLRDRASFILTPFRKRDISSSAGLGPFEETGVENMYPTSGTRPPVFGMSPVIDSQEYSRKVSTSSSKKSFTIRTKLARYFRRSSTTSSTAPTASAANGGLPMHHIEATRGQFSSLATQHDLISGPPTDLVPEISHADISAIGERELRASMTVADPFGVVTVRNSYIPAQSRDKLAVPPVQYTNSRAASPSATVETGVSRSRVTSWADSTVMGESVERLSVIAEDAFSPEKLGAYLLGASKAKGDQTPHGSVSKKAGSIGSAFLKRLVRRPNFQESRENEVQADEMGRQRRRISLADSLASWRNRQTVRSVPSEPTAEKDMIHDHCSEDSPATLPAHMDYAVSPHLQRKPVPSSSSFCNLQGTSATPSPEICNQRAVRAKNRWAGPLNESQGLFFPRSPVSPNRGTRIQNSLDSDTTPKTQDKRKGKAILRPNDDFFDHQRLNTISPSIYSQPSGFNNSPAPLWRDGMGTVTIVESKSYPTESPGKKKKTSMPVLNASVDWNAWLSKEVAELSEGVGEMSFEGFTEDVVTSTPPRHKRENAMISDPEDSTAILNEETIFEGIDEQDEVLDQTVEDSVAIDLTPAPLLANVDPVTPKEIKQSPVFTDERRSSRVMNDRFPMIDTGGPSSSPASSLQNLNEKRKSIGIADSGSSTGSSSRLSAPETPVDPRGNRLRARERRRSKLDQQATVSDEKNPNDAKLADMTVTAQSTGKENCRPATASCSDGSERPFLQIRSATKTASSFLVNKGQFAHSSSALPISPFTTSDTSNPQQSTTERRMFGRAINRAPYHSMATLTTATSFHTARESPWNKSDGSNVSAHIRYETPTPTPGREEISENAGVSLKVRDNSESVGFRSSPLRESLDNDGPLQGVEPVSLLAQTNGPSTCSLASDMTLMEFLRGSYREISNSTSSLALPAAGTSGADPIRRVTLVAPDVRQHTSRLPVPITYTTPEISPQRAPIGRVAGDNKENAPRSVPRSSTASGQYLQPRFTRAQTTSPAGAIVGSAWQSSPLRISPTRSQTGGQKLAEKWLNERSAQSSPAVGERTDVSGVTQMFL